MSAALLDTPNSLAPTLPDARALSAAEAIVRAVLPPTPQFRWPLLDQRIGASVWVKHENFQPVGAFKVRGGLVYLAALARQRPRPLGVVSATRGNHGQSIGFAARRHGLRAAIVVPHGNAREKNAAMRALGVELVEEGEDFTAAGEAADRIARERGWHRMPSFHPDLVAGVATYALELLRAVPDLEECYVPVGLGSGACGMLAAKAALHHPVRIVLVASAGAPAYARSLAAGAPMSVEVTTTLADGLAVRTPHPEAFALLRAGIDRVVQVSDAEVAHAMRVLFSDTHTVAEGAGAAGLAAILAAPEQVRGRTVGFICCGGNVDRNVFARVLAGEDA